jgi:hypothetical protein
MSFGHVASIFMSGSETAAQPHKWHNKTGGFTFGKHHVVARTGEEPLAGR